MKPIVFLYESSCNHCKHALDLLAGLQQSNAAYQSILIEKIDMEKEPWRAETLDYYYMPALFIEGKQIASGILTKSILEKALMLALQE